MKSAEKLIIVCFLFEVVLCREFSISLPESVEALRGLCVLIPCRFEIEEQYDADLQRDPTGIWLKDGTHAVDNRVFNSKVTEENKIKGEIIGDLRMKNCTTIFYNISESNRGVYYFRIETSGPLKYTYTSTSVSVRVRDSPISPSIRLYKENQGEVELQNEVVEGTSVRIICSAPSPSCLLKPPTFTWNFLSEERRQEQKHNTSFSSSQLNFNATHLHHGQDFTCTVTYWLQNKNISVQSSVTLHVPYGPRNTSVSASPSALMVLGSSVSLNCSSDANPAVLNYTWYRENGEQIGTGNHLTINTTDSTHSGLYYCRGENQHGVHNSSVYLHVQYNSYSPLIRLYKEDQGEVEDQNEVVEGTSVRLICFAPAPPCFLKPSTVTRNCLPEERRQEQNHNNSFSSSQLNFNATHLHHRLHFTHTATYWLQNKNISVHSSVTFHVLYGPGDTPITTSTSTSVVLGSSVSLSCSSDANPAVLNYTWYRENGEQIGTGNHLTINTTDSTHSGLYYCRAQNQHGDHNSSVYLDVQYSPIRPLVRLYEDQGKDQNEVVEGTPKKLICSAPSPPCLLKSPTFTWNSLPEERRQEQNHNSSFNSSQLNFNATHLHHGQDFTCTATYWLQNKTISVQSSLTLHVLYGPRNTSVSVSPSALVVLGSSVSLNCSSDANPAVLNYTWYRENGEQIGTGNHLTINTTDSTHSGLYYCRAQNHHGDDNSSVYLDVQYGPRNTSVSASPSASVLLGSSVSLSCSSDANPAVLNYTWYRENGEQIGTGNHLTINTTDSTHSGLYYCRAQNQHGDHNSSVYLDVQYGPKNTSVSVSPSASVVLGSSVSLSCSSDANPAVLNYTWYRENGEQIETGNHLTINTTDSTHSGLYYCRAQNQHGDHNSSIYLDVQYGPKNTSVTASPSASVLLGSSVSLNCSSDANPAVLNYTWYSENGEQIGTGNHLTINTTDSTHSGLYYCRAQNQQGDHNSSVYLDVQFSPQVSLSSSCNSTQDLIICFCEAHGNPYPKLEWHLSGLNLSNTTEESVNNTTARSFIFIHQTFTTILTLHCISSNSLGTDTQLFYFEKVPHHSAKGVCISSVLISAAAGATLMMMLCGILLRVRRVNPSQSGQENTSGFILNAVRQEDEEEQSVYVNRPDLSDLLHYSTIKFSSRAECDIKGASSLTAEYASVYHGSKQQHKRRITDTEDTDRDPEELEDSDRAKKIYAEVKRNKHKGKV